MQQLINALRDNSPIPFKSDEEKVISEFAAKHMKGFAEWANDNYYKITETRVWFKDHIQEGTYSTDQLIGKYFEKPNS